MNLSQTAQFKKDMKRQLRQGKEQKKLIEVVEILLAGRPLPEKHKNHPLKGAWRDRQDCHIEPDWILIYRVTGNELRLERTGIHSELF